MPAAAYTPNNINNTPEEFARRTLIVNAAIQVLSKLAGAADPAVRDYVAAVLKDDGRFQNVERDGGVFLADGFAEWQPPTPSAGDPPPLFTMEWVEPRDGMFTHPLHSVPRLRFGVEDCARDLEDVQRVNLPRILDALNQAIAGRTLILE